MRNSSLQMAALEQQKADENVIKLAEDQKVFYLFLSIVNDQKFPVGIRIEGY